MILPMHNAHLVQVQAPGQVADPVLGINTSAPTTRWQGDCQASLKDTETERVRDNQRYVIREVEVMLPINFPVALNDNDLLTFKLMDTYGGFSEQVTLEIRLIDKTTWPIGRLELTCRYA